MNKVRLRLGAGLLLVAALTSAPALARPAFLQESLLARIAPPSNESMALFAEAGMSEVRPHVLTPPEQARLRQAVQGLPPALSRALSGHLDRLSFVDGFAGSGNGLTRQTRSDDNGLHYDITLNGQVLGESLSALLTRKEQINLPPGTGTILRIHASRVSALRYVLLHEAAHVWEGTLSPDHVSALRAGLWDGPHTLSSAWAASALARNAFRHQSPADAAQLLETYRALSHSPFVSLYATASASEDLAETVAWGVLSRQAMTRLTIGLTLPDGRTRRVRPLRNEAVRQRWRGIRDDLDAAPSDRVPPA